MISNSLSICEEQVTLSFSARLPYFGGKACENEREVTHHNYKEMGLSL